MSSFLRTTFRSIVWLLTVVLLLAQCKKPGDIPVTPTPTTPTQDIIKPGENVGYGALLLSQEEYAKVPVIQEPQVGARMAAVGALTKTPTLPTTYDLTAKMPPIGNQGIQGSCTAWAVAYAARSYFNAAAKGISYVGSDSKRNEDAVLSPAFIFNQAKGPDCGGVHIPTALQLLQTTGVCSLKDMPYNPADCNTQPTTDQKQKAAAFKITKWGRVDTKTNTFRRFLYYDYPIIIAARLDDNFKKLTQKDTNGEYIWKTYDVTGTPSPHAMVIIGYDDDRKAFKVQNSWSERWANKGYIWLAYDLVETAIREAYVLIPNELKADLKAPVVQTETATPSTGSQQILRGTITNLGDMPPIRYGICTSTVSAEPTDQLEVKNTFITTLPHSFSVSLPTVNGRLYYRAFVETLSGIQYGATNTVVSTATSTSALGTLILNDEDNIWAFDAATGKSKWSLNVFGYFDHSKLGGLITPTTFYIGNKYGELMAINLSNGTTKWKFATGKLNFNVPVIANNIVYFTSGDTVYGIDANTGARKWSYTVPDVGILYNVTVANSLVFVGINTKGGSGEQKIIALDANTGQKSKELLGYNDVVSLKAANGLLFVPVSSRLRAYDVATGQSKWQTGIIANLRMLAVDNNLLYALYIDRFSTIGAYDIATGTLKWQKQATATDNNSAYRHFSVHKGTLVISTGNEEMALDALTGAAKWSVPKTKIVGTSPIQHALVTPSLVFTTDDNNRSQTAYDTQTGKQVWTNTLRSISGWHCMVDNDGILYHSPTTGIQP